MLMERLGYDELLTEIQLGHQMLNKYGKAYNRMQAVPERTRMMTEWANYLDNIKAGKIDMGRYDPGSRGSFPLPLKTR